MISISCFGIQLQSTENFKCVRLVLNVYEYVYCFWFIINVELNKLQWYTDYQVVKTNIDGLQFLFYTVNRKKKNKIICI